MKKKNIFKLLFVFVATVIFAGVVNAQSITLEQIKESFNGNTVLETYKKAGYEISAGIDDTEENVLRITLSDKTNGTRGVSYKLKDNILSYDYLTKDSVITAYFLADSIAHLYGKDYNELVYNYNIFTDEVQTLTIADDGFELKDVGNGYVATKIDITRAATLFDENKFYFKTDDFDKAKEFVEKDSTGNVTSRVYNLAYDIVFTNDNVDIFIGENKSALTENSYKSILSAIEAMYGEKVVNYFEENYPEIINDNIEEFNGFTVNVGGVVDKKFDDMNDAKIIQVTIDREYIYENYLRTEYIGETVDHGQKSLIIDFSDEQTYKLSFTDKVNSSDMSFLYYYVLNSLVDPEDESNVDTIYFNVIDGKIVLGDKKNSVFKAVYDGKDLIFSATDNNGVKDMITATNKDCIGIEYEPNNDKPNHYRYGKYNVETNIIYGTSVEYEVLDGDKQVVNTSKSDGLTFRFSIDYDKFSESGSVYVDNEFVDEEFYTTKKGSTIISFTDDFIASLSEGEHSIDVYVTDGKASSTFTIKNTEKNPNTSDNIVISIILLSISIIGVVAISIYSRKRAQN